MSAFEEALTRVLARQQGRALPTRRTSALASDPAEAIGIAAIKIVTEEQVQALAYGRFGGEPSVIVRLDPIGRDVADLLPFAQFRRLWCRARSRTSMPSSGAKRPAGPTSPACCGWPISPRAWSRILAGREPEGLTVNRLMKQAQLPLDWAGQHRMLGFG